MWVKGASAPGASGRRCSLPFRCCACRYVCRALVPRACPFRMAPALCPSAGPSAPARASRHTCTPLKTRAKAAARAPLFMPGLFTPHVSTRLLRTSAFFRQMPQKKRRLPNHGATFRICLAETARPARAHPRNLHLHGGSMDILFFLAVGLPFAFLPSETALLIAAAGIGILFLLLDL